MIATWNEDLFSHITGVEGRQTHSWLFTGLQGLGKKDLALEYAHSLLADTPGFSAAVHPDFHVLVPENQTDANGDLLQQYGMRYYLTKEGRKAKSVISVDQVRALSNALVLHGHGTNKVALIYPAHLMNLNAANALLKVLEEPPSGTIFVLVTDRWDLLPPTIRSRCSVLQFHSPPHDVAREWLSKHIECDSERDLLLKIAGGAPLLAQQLHETGYLNERNQIIQDVRNLVSETGDVVPIAAKWKEMGPVMPLEVLHRCLVDVARSAGTTIPPVLYNPDQADWLQEAAKDLNLGKVFQLMDKIGTYLQDTNAPMDQNLVLEDFLLDLSGAKHRNG